MGRRRQPETAPMMDIWSRLEAQALSQAVAEHHEHRMQRRRNSRSNWEAGRQTLAEIGRLIHHRHLGACDTDDGETYLRAALPWLMTRQTDLDINEVIRKWVAEFTPKVGAETIALCLAEAEKRSARHKLWWKPQALGNILALTKAERETLRITRFRPHGMKQCHFEVYQRQQKAAREKARRIANGARPHEQSAAQLEPWAALGMSRRTYYRRQAKGTLPSQIRDSGTNSWRPGTEYLQLGTGECQIVRQTREGPARTASPSLNVGADGHSPRAKAKAIPLGHAVPLPLPVEGVSEHADLLDGLDRPTEFQSLGDALAYAGGTMPPEVARAVRQAQRVRLMTQEAVARQIGISRPQLANALKGRFGLSRSAAANLVEWLTAA